MTFFKQKKAGFPVNFVLAALLLMLTGNLFSQTEELVNISYDPQADSVFFNKMQTRMAEIRKTRPTVAVVFSGGGARGVAHIGVLKYLEEKGIPIDFVAGTSMGGLMGGLYAIGYSVSEIDSLVRNIDWNVMMSDNIPIDFYSYDQKMYKSTYVLDIPFTGTSFKRSLPSGFKYGLNIYNMMSAKTVGYQHDMDFADLPTPYCCVATEIVTQTEKHWTSGKLIEAFRSTMSIPGYFQPVRIDSMILADGGTKNNFPVDVAKAAGADIVIGVELYMPRDYSDVNNIADILVHTTLYSGSLEARNRNRDNTTVYITPDLSGYGSLSFSTEDVAIMIDRGYQAAAAHEREIDSLVRIVGSTGRILQHPKAIDITESKVPISSIEFQGITEDEIRYFENKIGIHPGGFYNAKDLERVQSIIYGTMAFSHVTYRLIGDGAGAYKLLLLCDKRPSDSFGIGVRADSEEWFALLINAGFGRNKIYGFEFDAKLRLSISPYLELEWLYLPMKGPMFGASLRTQYRNLRGNDSHQYVHQYSEQSWRNSLKFYVADAHWSYVDLSGGVRIDHMPYYNLFSPAGNVRSWNWITFYPYLYLRFAYDNENERYFPDKGLRVTTSYDYDFHKTHFMSAGIQGAIRVCDFFTILPSLRGRYILGVVNKYTFMDNYVGGTLEGRYYEHQTPFIGFNGEKTCDEVLTTVDVDLRFRIIKNLYVSLLAAALHDGVNLRSMNKPIYAAGLQVAYKTKFGPLKANLHWNSENKKVGFYMSAGYDF